MALNLESISSVMDFIRKNEKRGDKLDINDYGIEYASKGFKEIPKLGTGGNFPPNQAIVFIVPTGLLWVIKGIEIIIEYDTAISNVDFTGTDAKIKFTYPEIASDTNASARTITVDIDNENVTGLLRICDVIGDRKWQMNNYSTELLKKYIFAFLDLNFLILDYEQNANSQKEIRIVSTDLIIPAQEFIYFRPVGWKFLKTNY